MVELFVLAIIMVPLLFAIPMIGKLIDVRQTAVQASRYTAWESTVGGPGSEGSAVSARFFADPYSPIVTGAGSEGYNPLWGDELRARGVHERNTRVAVKSADVAEIAHVPVRGNEDSVAAAVGETVHRAGTIMKSVSNLGGGAEWGLAGDGLTVGGVRVGVERNGWLDRAATDCPVAGAYTCLDELSVIMSDGWSAGGTDQAARRVRSLVPANALSKVGKMVSKAGKVKPFAELKGLKNAFGHVDMSVLPASENNRRPLERYDEEEAR